MQALMRIAFVIGLLLLSTTALTTTPTSLHFVTKEFPPYAWRGAEGQAAGPMVELLQRACARAHWQCHVEVMPWKRAYGLAASGQVDGVFPIVVSAERRATFRLSPEVVEGRYVLLSREGLGSPASLAGRTIAAYGPSDASLSLRRLTESAPQAQTAVESDHGTVLRKLLAGRYGHDGLALVNEAVARTLVPRAAAGQLQAVGVVKELAYSYALVPGRASPTQAAAFAEAIRELCRSGQTAEIFRPAGLRASGCARG